MLTFGKPAPGEKDRIFALCASCLNTSADYFAARDEHDPYLLRDERIVARDGGRVVSNITLFELPLSFGCAKVPAGGIADVATNPAYRGQGSASELLRRAHETMRNRDLPLAVLGTGIHRFYERIGYSTWETPGVRFLALRSPSGTDGARPIDLGRDLPVLEKLNSSERPGRVGVLIRSRELWLAQPRWSRIFPVDDPELSLIESNGRAFLRATYNPAQSLASILEFAAEPGNAGAVTELAAALLRRLAQREAKALWVPGACHDLITALIPHAQAQERFPNRHLMLKVLSWPGLLRALQPELMIRADAAKIKSGTVSLYYGDQVATLRISGGKIAVEEEAGAPYARLEPAQWLEVFMATKLFSAQPFAGSSRLGEVEINLLDGLFPKRDSLFWEADSF
jgi:GNAT superfamily N-acetyltransferase